MDKKSSLQRIVDVQQKLGDFMLCVQRYEMQLKTLLIESTNSGTLEFELDNQRHRKNLYAAKPMGFLFDELNRSYLREIGSIHQDPNISGSGNETLSFKTSYFLELSPEQLTQTRIRLEGFKNLRNRIVHHLLEDFNLAIEEECNQAVLLLDEGLEAARRSYEELLRWTNAMLEAKNRLEAFVRGPHFGALLHGIRPDGTVDWPNSTAVHLLQSQENTRSTGEMTRLDLAIDKIRICHPDQRPQIYGCKSWRQLIARSGQFDIKNIKGNLEQQGVTWYQSRT